MSDVLARLGGADMAILRQTPSARIRFVQMAGVFFTTSLLAAASMSFALHDTMRTPWPWAVMVGIVWGGMIFNIDRFLVLSMGSTREKGRLLLMALPRLLMAALLSLAISTPLVLHIFQSSIQNEMFKEQVMNAPKQDAQIFNSLKTQQDDVSRKIQNDRAIVAGNLPNSVFTSPQLRQAQQKVSQLQSQLSVAQKAEQTALVTWQCELYPQASCPPDTGTSGRAGAGPAAQQRLDQLNQARGTVNDLNTKLQTAKNDEQHQQALVDQAHQNALTDAQQSARAELPGLEKRQAILQGQSQKLQDKGSSLSEADTGILAQLQALSNLTKTNGTLRSAHLVLMGVFFMMEILPVLVKLLLSLNPKTAYEVVAEAEEDELIDQAQSRRDMVRMIQEGKTRSRLAVEEDLRREEEALGKRANEYVAAEQLRILDAALKEWSDQLPRPDETSGRQPAAAGAGKSSKRSASSPIVQMFNGRSWLPDSGDI
jgi:hypothetical protein